jgi:hypothetical protein
MANARVEPTGSSAAGGEAGRLVLGAAIPLAVVTLAYGLWWISDRLLYIGRWIERPSVGRS